MTLGYMIRRVVSLRNLSIKNQHLQFGMSDIETFTFGHIFVTTSFFFFFLYLNNVVYFSLTAVVWATYFFVPSSKKKMTVYPCEVPSQGHSVNFNMPCRLYLKPHHPKHALQIWWKCLTAFIWHGKKQRET